MKIEYSFVILILVCEYSVSALSLRKHGNKTCEIFMELESGGKVSSFMLLAF